MVVDFVAIARQHVQTARLLGVDFMPRSVMRRRTAPNQSVPPFESIGEGSDGDRQRLLDTLQARHDARCPHCTVVKTHTRTVFGEGNPEARLMFIGEAPGEDEDRTGRPFVGKAGQKLDEIIKAMGMRREDVYIANVLKARPPENRTPLPDEVEKCVPFLHEQIRIIGPEVIVALGNPATKLLLKTDVGITRLRGQWGTYSHGEVRIPVMPTFHPAYLLRNYTVDTRQKMWSDMQAVVQRLQSSGK